MDAQEIKKLDKMHIMHSWSVDASLNPRVIKDVDGAYFIDSDGRKFLDFSSQLKCVSVGHKNKKIIKAIQEQADKICYLSPGFAEESRARLGKALAEITPGDLNKFFFTLSGAESNENAIKMARAYTNRHKILAHFRSYHGATYGAISLTGDPRRPPVEPGIPGIVHILNPYCYRCSFGLTYPQCGLQCAEHIAEVIQYETADTVAAIIVETITGAGGNIIPPEGYLGRVKEICEENNILFIADEVMTGFGRTGQWFGIQHWDVVPDIMTMAKGLTSAYVPLGAVAISKKISNELENKMLYCGLTYNAHPLCCAAAIAAIEVYQEENLIENSHVMGEILKSELQKLKEKHACVGDVRSIGLFASIELVKNKKTKEPLVPYNATGEAAKIAKEISARLMSKGLFTLVRWMFLSIAPPLPIKEDQLRQGLRIIDEVLDFVDTLTES
jgi:taurine--2-oxoglutarate transaminase